MKSIKIKTKAIILVLVLTIIVSLVVAIITLHETKELNQIQIKLLREEVYKDKKNEIKNYMEIAKTILSETYKRYGDKGKQIAINHIRKIKLSDDGFFWIYNSKNIMLTHPLDAYNGKDVSDVKDGEGQNINDKITALLKNKDEGTLSYLIKKANANNLKRKISHVYLFKPWNWVIGTGVYFENIENHIKLMKKNASKQSKSIVYKASIFIISVILISYFIMIFTFERIIEKPLNRFKIYFDNFLKFIIMKDNKFEEASIENKDEINELLIMLNKTAKDFDKKLKDDIKVMGEVVLAADRLEQGIYSCKIKSSTQNPMIATLKKSLNKMINIQSQNMENIKNTLISYEKQDFNKKININPRLKETMLDVMNGVNNLGLTLLNHSKENLKNGKILEENSSIMKKSMNKLANKSNEQAASLEQTAAAIEEITSITKNNTENASQMTSLSSTVKNSVTKGEELASKTVNSMEEINEKVSAINEAIDIIDQIAFQTNILSLNAAVEAATAGEAGKGFAVVAGEVRNLASRSAQAANDIKKLVDEANLKANEGKNISANMIEGYKELNTSINNTIELIHNVSLASKEQMDGIVQINDAINMLDKVTQENANESIQIKNISIEVSNMAAKLVEK